MKKFLSFALPALMLGGLALMAGMSAPLALAVGVAIMLICNLLPTPKHSEGTTFAVVGYRPDLKSRTQVIESGKATDVKTGNSEPLYTPQVSVTAEQEFEIIVTNTSTEADVDNVVIIPLGKDSAAPSAVTNITLTSSMGSRADTMAFLQKYGLHISEFDLQVLSGNSATMYSKKFVRGELQLDGTVINNNVRLTTYRDSNGGEILDTANIKDRPFVVDGWNSLTIATLPKSTSLAIRCKIVGKSVPQMKLVK